MLPERFDLFRHAVDAVFVGNTDLHALQRLAERGFVIRHRQVDRGRVLGVDACHRLQQDGGIAHVAGDRAGLVERRGEGDDAPARAAAVCRLDADSAGEGSRLADGAAGIGSSRAGAEMRRNGSGRATRRAAGNELLVGAFGTPGVDDRAEIGALVGRAHGELVHVELAQHDGAIVPQVLRDCGFIARLEAVENVAAGLGVDAFGAEQVLDPKWNAFERTGIAGGEARIRGLRHLARLFGRHGDIGIDLTVGRVDRRDIGLGQFGGGDLLGAQLVAGFGNGQAGEFAHFGSLQIWNWATVGKGSKEPLFDDFGHQEEILIGIRRIGDDVGGLVAVGHFIGALLHCHRRYRGHGLDAIDIHFGELLDEAQNAVQLTHHPLLTAMRARWATRLTVARSTDMAFSG